MLILSVLVMLHSSLSSTPFPNIYSLGMGALTALMQPSGDRVTPQAAWL